VFSENILNRYGQGLEQVSNDTEKMENPVPRDNGGAEKRERKNSTGGRPLPGLCSKELDNFYWEVNSVNPIKH
jgi:hypothetical protein